MPTDCSVPPLKQPVGCRELPWCCSQEWRVGMVRTQSLTGHLWSRASSEQGSTEHRLLSLCTLQQLGGWKSQGCSGTHLFTCALPPHNCCSSWPRFGGRVEKQRRELRLPLELTTEFYPSLHRKMPKTQHSPISTAVEEMEQLNKHLWVMVCLWAKVVGKHRCLITWGSGLHPRCGFGTSEAKGHKPK